MYCDDSDTNGVTLYKYILITSQITEAAETDSTFPVRILWVTWARLKKNGKCRGNYQYALTTDNNSTEFFWQNSMQKTEYKTEYNINIQRNEFMLT